MNEVSNGEQQPAGGSKQILRDAAGANWRRRLVGDLRRGIWAALMAGRRVGWGVGGRGVGEEALMACRVPAGRPWRIQYACTLACETNVGLKYRWLV